MGTANNSDKVESLIHKAKHGAFFQREEAVKALGETRDERAIEPLVEILKSEGQSRTRRAAADSLGKLGWEPANYTDRAYLLIARGKWEELAELGIDYLILALRWPNEKETMPYFLKIGEAAVEPLLQALESKNYERRSVAAILGRLGDKRAAPTLARILKDPDEVYDVKNRMAQILNELGFEPRDETEKVYLLVAAKKWDEVAGLGEPAVETLIEALRRFGWPETREALAKIGKPAVEPLIQSLNHQASWTRFGAATALGEIGDERAVEPLTRLLNNENNEEVREATREALEKIRTEV